MGNSILDPLPRSSIMFDDIEPGPSSVRTDPTESTQAEQNYARYEAWQDVDPEGRYEEEDV